MQERKRRRDNKEDRKRRNMSWEFESLRLKVWQAFLTTQSQYSKHYLAQLDSFIHLLSPKEEKVRGGQGKERGFFLKKVVKKVVSQRESGWKPRKKQDKRGRTAHLVLHLKLLSGLVSCLSFLVERRQRISRMRSILKWKWEGTFTKWSNEHDLHELQRRRSLKKAFLSFLSF